MNTAKCLLLASAVACGNLLSAQIKENTMPGKTLIDYFLPMEPQGPMVSEKIWGDPNVLPRDIRNGLEDPTLENWCYWDGKIVRDDDGRYHIYASRWNQSFPHSVGWKKQSKGIHAVSDSIMGPYEDMGLIWPQWRDGIGHNVIGLRMHDGRYAAVTCEVTPGEIFVADSPNGPFKLLGRIKWDANGFNPGLARYNKNGHMSNVKVLLRPNDGRYMIVPRSTAVMISDDGILGPYKIMNDRVYKNYPELPQTRNEDPTVWYSGGMYHIVYNHWPTKTSHHFTSDDGIRDWTYRGVAFRKDAMIFRYTDGTVNDWEFVERPTAYVENGHVTHFIFSVIDVGKGQDRGNDNHASKIIVVPFDGKAFDRDMRKRIEADKEKDTEANRRSPEHTSPGNPNRQREADEGSNLRRSGTDPDYLTADPPPDADSAVTSKTSKFRYKADWDSIRSHYQIPEWFRDAKFGIFLHWGPYAVPAYMSEKYPKGIYAERFNKGGMNAYSYHREHYGDPSEFGYKDFIPLFKAEKFDAAEWAATFSKAGARYVVPVAEHHDGYAMYRSQHTRWNVVDTGPRKDTMRTLADACRAKGMKFGVSSHYALNRIYYSNKDPKWDTNDPACSDLYWKPVQKDSKPSQAFLDHWWNRTTDIIDQYRPDLLWFDFGLDKPGFESVHRRILAYYYNKGLEWNKEVVFQDKNMKNKSFPEDLIVLDIERGRMTDTNPFPWQTDTSIGKISWGYIDNEEYKTPDYLLGELIDIVSKNGCLLLNIGPKADGTIPDEAKQILKEMGAWLKQNGTAIYGTRPWKTFGEGPTKISQGHHSEKDNQPFGPEDIRFTTRENKLYAIVLGYPKNGIFKIKSLALGNPFEKSPVRSVKSVDDSPVSQWKQTGKALTIHASNTERKPAYAFEITFAK